MHANAIQMVAYTEIRKRNGRPLENEYNQMETMRLTQTFDVAMNGFEHMKNGVKKGIIDLMRHFKVEASSFKIKTAMTLDINNINGRAIHLKNIFKKIIENVNTIVEKINNEDKKSEETINANNQEPNFDNLYLFRKDIIQCRKDVVEAMMKIYDVEQYIINLDNHFN